MGGIGIRDGRDDAFCFDWMMGFWFFHSDGVFFLGSFFLHVGLLAALDGIGRVIAFAFALVLRSRDPVGGIDMGIWCGKGREGNSALLLIILMIVNGMLDR